MIGWEELVYAFVCGAMLMMSGLGLESTVVTPGLSRWEKRFFAILFSALVLCSAGFFPELAACFNPGLAVLQPIAYFAQSLCGVLPFPLLAVYLLHCCEEDWRRSALARAVLALWVAFCVLLVVAQFSDRFWRFEPDGRTTFGPVYNLLVAPVLAIQLAVLAGAVRRRGKLSRPRFRAFLLFLVPAALAVTVHMVVGSALTLIDITVAVSAYAAYRIVVSDSIEQDLRHQREIASQRASIAVLQMRPHFIYNAMTSIYYLCDQDPGLAKRVTMDFTTYLRKNFTAIAREEAVPFSEELEHTRAYLAVEQAQFEGDLLVEYDTPHTRFRVPPLTLQPIVENAVKHGMDPDSGPLRIWVRTREAGSGSEVVVADDGPGFDPAIADDPRTTLANIRQRLDLMCGGRLSIAARAGGGTVVTMTVPLA